MAEHAPCAHIAELVAEHHAALYRYAYRLSGSVADAEDLAQQVFLIAQTKLDQVRSADGARAWLYAVLRNAYLKSRRKRVPLAAGDLDLALDGIPEELPEPVLVDSEELQEALDALPDEFKIVVMMFYFEHCSYKEIAAQLELPLGTVMSRLSRAKAQLRCRLFPDEVVNPTTPPTRSPRPAKVTG